MYELDIHVFVFEHCFISIVVFLQEGLSHFLLRKHWRNYQNWIVSRVTLGIGHASLYMEIYLKLRHHSLSSWSYIKTYKINHYNSSEQKSEKMIKINLKKLKEKRSSLFLKSFHMKFQTFSVGRNNPGLHCVWI